MTSQIGPIDFLAYDSDNRVLQARVVLTGDRLTDVLAAGAPIPAEEIVVRDLRTHVAADPGLRAIDPTRLAIVVATGPRGSMLHRVDTEAQPVSIHVDRYVVHGWIHAPAPKNPLDHVHTRPWLPVTDAVLEHHGAGRPWRERFGTLLVNRSHAKGIALIDEQTHEMHWLAGTAPVAWAPELIEEIL